MKITIAQRLRPFSRAPGSKCLIPGTSWIVQAFPRRLVFIEPSGKEHVFDLPVHGPAKNFTLEQDLERGYVNIFGIWQEGYCSWQIAAKEEAISMRLKRCPDGFCKEEAHFPSTSEVASCSSLERLAFGSHKKQEWELMHRRLDMAEIIPFWFRLAQITPTSKGSLSPPEKEMLPEVLRQMFLGHFGSLFIPKTDDCHQGLQISSTSPLHEGAALVRHALFREETGGYSLLPALPSSWHCGRFINIATAYGDTLDLEWSKKEIRRVILRPAAARTITLKLQPAIKSFRVRTSLQDKGERQSASSPLVLSANTPLFLDRFEK